MHHFVKSRREIRFVTRPQCYMPERRFHFQLSSLQASIQYNAQPSSTRFHRPNLEFQTSGLSDHFPLADDYLSRGGAGKGAAPEGGSGAERGYNCARPCGRLVGLFQSNSIQGDRMLI